MVGAGVPQAHPDYSISLQAAEALGYLGGGILALCLVPQLVRAIRTRSTGDLSIAWCVLYLLGLALTLSYLVLIGAIAAWIPLVFEIAMLSAIFGLKVFYDHTAAGRRWVAAKNGEAAAKAAAAKGGSITSNGAGGGAAALSVSAV